MERVCGNVWGYLEKNFAGKRRDSFGEPDRNYLCIAQMHDKSVITDNYTTFGSYNLSAFARVGNWGSITIVDTRQVHKDKFDAIWNSISNRQFERYYRELDSPTRGPKRKRRDDDLSNAKRPAS